MKKRRHRNPSKQFVTILIASVLSMTWCVPAAGADDEIQRQLDELRQRLDAVQEDTSEMRDTLDELRAETERDWLTLERSRQIRDLVQDVLADADSRSTLVGDGLLGGWSDGFFLASSDGRFKLKIGGMIQERYVLSFLRVGLSGFDDRWRTGLENTRTRLHLSGHIFDRDTTFMVQPGFGWLDPNAIQPSPLTRIGARLWDAWIQFKINDQWAAKLGVFMLPFTRESLVPDTHQLAVDRSLIDYRVGLARSQGINFTWVNNRKRVFLAVSNGSITFNGTVAGNQNPTPPWGASEKDTDWALTARAEFLLEGRWEQFKQFTSPVGSERATMVGIAVHAQNKERVTGEVDQFGNPVPKQDQVGVTADLSMHFDGATFFMSGTFHNQTNFNTNTPNADWVGYVFQGSTYTAPNTELFMRFEGGGIMQNQLGGDDVHIITGGFNWYLDGQGLKVTSDFGWSLGELPQRMENYMLGWRGSDNRNAEWLFRTQLQLLF